MSNRDWSTIDLSGRPSVLERSKARLDEYMRESKRPLLHSVLDNINKSTGTSASSSKSAVWSQNLSENEMNRRPAGPQTSKNAAGNQPPAHFYHLHRLYQLNVTFDTPILPLELRSDRCTAYLISKRLTCFESLNRYY